MRHMVRVLKLAAVIAVAATSLGGAQQAGQASQEVPAWCWGCGHAITGTNPNECYYPWPAVFAHSASYCNTNWGPEGSECELVGPFCGDPFFAAVDGSVGTPAAQLAYSATAMPDGGLLDCEGRIVARGLMDSDDLIGSIATLSL